MKAKIPRILVLFVFIVATVLSVRAENLPDKQTKQEQKNVKKLKNKPLMTNELGTRIAPDAPEREEKAIQDMIKKLALSQELKLKAVIWFPFSNQRHNIVGILNEDKSIKKEIIEAFEDLVKIKTDSPK